MAADAGKTVRFSRIVEQSGRPHVHTLWLPADKDPEFRRASEGHRVLTVARDRGKTDRGVVGFERRAPHEEAQYLIFPKSLKRFEGARVVGIKFDLVEQPPLEAPAPRSGPRSNPPARKRAGSAKPAKQPRKSASRPPPAKEEPRLRSESPPDETPARAEVVPFAVEHAGPKRAAPKSGRVRQAGKSSPAREQPTPKNNPAHAELVRAVKSAMKDLQRGKSVAAYQRLAKALES